MSGFKRLILKYCTKLLAPLSILIHNRRSFASVVLTKACMMMARYLKDTLHAMNTDAKAALSCVILGFLFSMLVAFLDTA